MNLIALSNLINYMAKEISKKKEKEQCGSGSERHTAMRTEKIIMLIHKERDEEASRKMLMGFWTNGEIHSLSLCF